MSPKRKIPVIAMAQSQLVSSDQKIDSSSNHSGLGYLFAAAVVNRQFREMLLEDPETALQKGYLGEVFELSREERKQITSARARSLADLARKVTLADHSRRSKRRTGPTGSRFNQETRRGGDAV